MEKGRNPGVESSGESVGVSSGADVGRGIDRGAGVCAGKSADTNPQPLSWSRIERILSGKFRGKLRPNTSINGSASGLGSTIVGAFDVWPRDAQVGGSVACDGAEGDSEKETVVGSAVGAELHTRSSYSFLNGAADPEELVAEAARLGLSTLGLTDRDGFYGIARFAEAAAYAGIATIIGAELSLDQGPLTVLVRGPEGYRRLSHIICQAHMVAGRKADPCYPSLLELAEAAAGTWQVLLDDTWVPHAAEIVTAFGAENVAVEYRVDLAPDAVDKQEKLDKVAEKWQLRKVISAVATAATPAQSRLAGAKQALAIREDLDTFEPNLAPAGGSWLRSWAELCDFASDIEGAAADTQQIARECAFTLDLIAPNLPRWEVPEGHTEITWLKELARAGARRRYGPLEGGDDRIQRAWQQLEHELAVIEVLGFPGYFLIVHDICEFCQRENILAQGRGSAANSVVCFALGITNVDPISAKLLFERFLSPERDGPPDIDLDIESGRREEVIQYIYRKYGRDNAAQVANVITYRSRGALRDAARVLGHDAGVIDAWVHKLAEPPAEVLSLAEQLRGQPRHLGIHSGGMVICDRPIADVVPTQWARMENRSMVQWDKDDCAAAGLVKFDLLGLGMLEAIHHCIDLVHEQHGRKINLWEIDIAEPEVYAMLARADAVGVFQVESRAQMATLPRLKPREFFDLVVEVALIRPGPIQGGSVHPYIRRRNGEEEVTFDHPVLEKSLAKTLGIPLFQEQLMQMAVDAAGFSGAEADSLRRAMGSKRSVAKMEEHHARFLQGLKETNNIDGEIGERLWNKIVAFAAYGFPESHAQSFASLVYFSAWFKYHYPAEFCVALLRAQPMGFYSPQSLVADARRHSIGCDGPDINASEVEAAVHNGRIRLGLAGVSGIGEKVAERIIAARNTDGDYLDIASLSRRANLSVSHVEALARAGAFESLGMSRRQALWAAGVAATEHEGMLPGLTMQSTPALPGMSTFELAAADLAGTGVTPDEYPIAALRAELDALEVIRASDLLSVPDGSRVQIAGIVTHRQRPGTAAGVVFMGMEDETGLMNILCQPGLWEHFRAVATTARAMFVRGIVQNASGAVTIVADKLTPLQEVLAAPVIAGRSRDFR